VTGTLTLQALRRLRTTPGGQFDCRISFSDGPGTSRPVAYVERELLPNGISAYLAARKSGARSFVLWADEQRQARVATLVTVSPGSGRAQFQVLGPHGELLGMFRRDKAFSRGLRTRWTVSRAGSPDAVGYKGRLFWWCVWWLCSPLLPLILVAVGSECGGRVSRISAKGWPGNGPDLGTRGPKHRRVCGGAAAPGRSSGE
jgi:hypothetical protein